METELRIRVFSGKEFVLPAVPLTDTVCQIKKRVYSAKGFSVEQQMLSVPKITERLDDQTRLADIPALVAASKKVLKLRVYYKMIPLRVIRPGRFGSDLIIKTYPCCSILNLKRIIEKHTGISSQDQTLSYNSVVMNNEKLLIDYNIKDPEESLNVSTIEEANATTTSRPFEISLFVRKGDKSKLSLGIDFSFNIIKNVKKVTWKNSAPWYREVSDGLSWFCYCRNVKCEIANELFIIHKGFGHFYLHRDMKVIKCPVCQKSLFEVRNIGFVWCQWQYKGTLANKKDSRITGEGRTYDHKLYTFKEANYNTMWDSLELVAKQLDHRGAIQNVSKDGSAEREEEEEEKGHPSEDLKSEPLPENDQGPIKKSTTLELNTNKCMSAKGICIIF